MKSVRATSKTDGRRPDRNGSGAHRESLDLDLKTLALDETLISVDGRAEQADGKSEAGERVLSLDAFTVAALRQHLAMFDEERTAFGSAYSAIGGEDETPADPEGGGAADDAC